MAVRDPKGEQGPVFYFLDIRNKRTYLDGLQEEYPVFGNVSHT